MKRPITINDVTISTASVNIQVMRIGSKQMTLAVFRQLPRQEIFDDCGSLIALPWGWVNYDSDYGCTPFVFSYEDCLYRTSVNLAAYRGLGVVASIDYEKTTDYNLAYPHKRAKTIVDGNWLIISNRTHDKWDSGPLIWDSPIDGYFTSEHAANLHLANVRESIAMLQAAPQLFIAV